MKIIVIILLNTGMNFYLIFYFWALVWSSSSSPKKKKVFDCFVWHAYHFSYNGCQLKNQQMHNHVLVYVKEVNLKVY